MGKVRKLRQKFRNFQTNEASKKVEKPVDAPQTASLIDELFTPEVLAGSDKITSSLLKQQFADYEERNTIATTLSAKSSIYAGMKKKTKKELRHQLWLKKVEGIRQAEKEAKDKKVREATAVTGDMKPMADALSDLSSFLEDVAADREAKQQKKSGQYKPILKQKEREKISAENAAKMRAVMQDPLYQARPFESIQQHLKLRFGASL